MNYYERCEPTGSDLKAGQTGMDVLMSEVYEDEVLEAAAGLGEVTFLYRTSPCSGSVTCCTACC